MIPKIKTKINRILFISILIVITLIIGIRTANAQSTFEKLNPFVSFGIDPKMALNGAGHDWGNSPSLDFEIRVGYYSTRENNIRLWHAYKSHKKIGFTKITYLGIDYKFKLHSKVYVFTGLEMSGITRESFTYHYSNPNDYRRFTANPLMFGSNLEIQYTPFKKFSRFSVFSRLGIYQAEDQLKEYKNFRVDVTAGIVFHLYTKQ